MVLPRAKQTCIFYQDTAYNLLCYKNISIQKSCLNSLSPVFNFNDLLNILSPVFNPPPPFSSPKHLYGKLMISILLNPVNVTMIFFNFSASSVTINSASNCNFFLYLPGKHRICWCSELSSIPVSLGANSTRLSYRTLAHYICLSPGQQLLTLAALLI